MRIPLLSRLRATRVDRSNDRATQLLLAASYRQTRPTFTDAEFSCYSQNGEDGILLLLFSVLGRTDRRVVELGAGDGIECNAANLIINHGWSGLLVDGNRKSLAKGRAFYAQHTNAWKLRRLPPILRHAWIDRDSVNPLLVSHGFEGSIDLLSLDVDGIDYWIWEAVTAIRPRVVVLEYNNRWSAEQSVTVPYTSDFVGTDVTMEGAGYFGASLRAFQRLGRRKGYRLVGANGPNTNAFFLRDDVGVVEFPTVSVEGCLSSDYARHQHRTKYPAIAHLPVVEIA